ncbi:allatotropin-like [Zootermopsis nevadensis]|uniref:allatotropin-like n=1 Tax=Zootermopsis nevadensis TaxID=136037 RepID=UPI000B8EA3B3|nr:allatotropin-like [Zootermopsis nevadensis]
MRASLSVNCMIAATVLVVLVLCDCVSSGPSYQNARNKPRTIRGFKNVALSTARGFGKRDGALSYLADNANTASEPTLESLPVEWFVEELRTNPELARIIVHKFVDADQDGELSAEELLRPMY